MADAFPPPQSRDEYITAKKQECQEELRLISLAVHDEAEEQLRRIFEEPRIHAWSFNELVFWNQPIRRSDSEADDERASPFLPFVSHRFSQVPTVADFASLTDLFASQEGRSSARDVVSRLRQIQMAPTTKDNYDEVQTAIEGGIDFARTPFGRRLRQSWASEPDRRDPRTRSVVVERDLNDLNVLRQRYSDDQWKGAYPFLIGERSLKHLLDDFGSLSEQPHSSGWKARVAEYALHDHTWVLGLRQYDDDATFLAQPTYCSCIVAIASPDFFYGYFVLYCPPLFERNDAPRLARAIVETLLKMADEYLPILTLFHLRWSERYAKERLKEVCKAEGALRHDEYGSIGQCVLDLITEADVFFRGTNPTAQSQNTMEADLHELWQTRKLLADELKEDATSVDAERKKQAIGLLKESFVLADYGMVSASMLAILQRLPKLARLRSTSGNLPCVLIVGGAGSGKEMMSRLVQLFFRQYAFGARMVLNMAALRPQAIVAPILLGIELTDSWRVESILELVGSPSKPNRKFGATVVFDELNSLDIDQQGVLLRIVENGEILPLGQHETRKVNFLCIGIMNEIPHDLMKEAELAEGFARSRMFGSIVGTMLEELFRKSRRLRPDLYYRFARIDPIVLPSLRDRNREIPFLFRLQAMKLLQPGDSLEIDVGALRLLMNPRLQWSGNMRELEAVATEAWNRAVSEGDGHNLRITMFMVEKALDAVRRRTQSTAVGESRS